MVLRYLEYFLNAVGECNNKNNLSHDVFTLLLTNTLFQSSVKLLQIAQQLIWNYQKLNCLKGEN